MSWSIRRQGSWCCIEGLSIPGIIAGIRDGEWDVTDEVVGPRESHWTPLELHRQFSEIVAEVEESLHSPLIEDAEEQRIDMNPLIDVCLVLLVFFILATTCQLMSRVLDLPASRVAANQPPAELSPTAVRDRMIFLQLRPGPGGVIYRLENETIPAQLLEAALQHEARTSHRQEMVIDAKDVSWGSVVKAIDAGAGARIKKVHFKAKRHSE